MTVRGRVAAKVGSIDFAGGADSICWGTRHGRKAERSHGVSSSGPEQTQDGAAVHNAGRLKAEQGQRLERRRVMSERPLSGKTCRDPRAHRLRGGSWKPVADCGFHPPRGAPYPVPRLPLTPGWSLSCLLPSRHPFYDGEGWFSPNPTDASSLCLSPTLPPWEAPRQPPEMSQQDGALATSSSSQMGPKRGSGSPTVTRHAVGSGLQGLASSMSHCSPGRLGEEPPALYTFHMRKLGLQGRPVLTQDASNRGVGI